MLLSGTNQSTVKVTLRNPLDHTDLLDYYIVPDDNQLVQDWLHALKKLLQQKNLLEKNFCFLGFPKTARTLEYLCDELNSAVETINCFDYKNISVNYFADFVSFFKLPFYILFCNLKIHLIR